MKSSVFAVLLILQILVPVAQAGDLAAPAAVKKTTFQLSPNPAFLDCLSGSNRKPPTAKVTVTRGKLNDKLLLQIKNVKPNQGFDLFTVQRSNLLPNGNPDPSFTNFGLAWYQSDVHANRGGNATVIINTILLDQIFGFDPDASLKPTNTFQVGIWFDDPNDAAPCGFDATHPTPFNGDHKAGPVAMISVPDATTGLGPLCTNPNTSTVPASCNP